MSPGPHDADAVLRALFAAAPWGLAYLDRDFRFVHVNASLAAANGAAVEAHIGRTVREVLGDLADRIEPILRRVIDTGAAVTGLRFSGAASGAPDRVRHWQIDHHPVAAADGSVIGVLAAIQDDTAQHELETAVRSAVGDLAPDEADTTAASREEHLRQLAVRLTEAHRAARMGSWTWSIDSGAVAWSDGIYQIFGVDRATTTPSYDNYIARLHPADRARIEAALAAALAGDAGLDEEYRIVQPEGEVRVVRSLGTVKRGPAGEPIRLSGTCVDVTERRAFEARMQVTDRLAAIGTLAGGIAHELNNPLGYVTGNLGFVVERLAELRGHIEQAVAAPQAAAFLQEVRALEVALTEGLQGAERIRVIVKDINRFARMDDDHTEPVVLHDVLESAVRLAWNEIKHRARLVRSYGEPPTVEANPSRLGQVVLDILVNAAQSIEEGKRDDHEIRLRTLRRADGHAVVEIHDTGCGIRPEILGRIFDPFYTTKPLATSTGLGLSVCHRIVTMMGGTLEVESKVGAGSVFRIALPPSNGATPTATAAATTADRTRRLRVLAIDDEPMILTYYRRTIGRAHEIVTMASAQEALVLLEQDQAFDVILCDLMMPHVTGWEFHEQLSVARPALVERIVFITGGAFTPRGRTFLDSVTNQWIEKPVDPRQLAALLRSRS